jgi:hypothetical protein
MGRLEYGRRWSLPLLSCCNGIRLDRLKKATKNRSYFIWFEIVTF